MDCNWKKTCCSPCPQICLPMEKLQGVLMSGFVEKKKCIVKPKGGGTIEIPKQTPEVPKRTVEVPKATGGAPKVVSKVAPKVAPKVTGGANEPGLLKGNCCCKAPCTLISSLLRKLKTSNAPAEKKSLTCVVFNELCTLTGTDPNNKNDANRNTALALAEKFGGWIEDLLQKKGTITCEGAKMKLEGAATLGDIFDCTCCEPKKEYPERKAKVEKKPGKKEKVEYIAPKPKPKRKNTKKTFDGDSEEVDEGKDKNKSTEDDEAARRAAQLAAEQAAALAAAEAAAAEAKAKAMAACKEQAAKKRQMLQEQMIKEKDESDRGDRDRCAKLKAEADAIARETSAMEDKKKKKMEDTDTVKSRKIQGTPSKTDDTTAKRSGNIAQTGPGGKCPCSGNSQSAPSTDRQQTVQSKRRRTLEQMFEDMDNIKTGKDDGDPSKGGSNAVVIDQYSKIVQHFLGTLDDMNDWIQNLVKETDQVIVGKMDGSDVNVLGEVEQDWKIFKNKMFLKTHHWKYFNKVARKMVTQLQESSCSCNKNTGCRCPNKQNTPKPVCAGRMAKCSAKCTDGTTAGDQADREAMNSLNDRRNKLLKSMQESGCS